MVETRTTAMSLRGYCRTLSARIDCRPAMRMTRLTTIASTGRLTNRSVNFMTWVRLLIFGFGCGAVRRLDFIVHLDGDPVPQLEHSRGHDFLARVQTRHDRDLIAARRSQLHNLLPNAAIRLPLRVLQVGEHEHRVAVRRVVDR